MGGVIASADIDGNGALDLVTPGSTGFAMLLNAGDGSFGEVQERFRQASEHVRERRRRDVAAPHRIPSGGHIEGHRA